MTVLRPMVQTEYAAWLEEAVPAYAGDKVASGQWSQEAALGLSRKEYDELLPQGLETPDNYLYTIADSESNAIGMLWFAQAAGRGEHRARPGSARHGRPKPASDGVRARGTRSCRTS